MVSTFGHISFNLTLLFKKNLAKLLIFFKKAFQKEVTIFFARIELSKFFFPDRPTYMQSKNGIKKGVSFRVFEIKNQKGLKTCFFPILAVFGPPKGPVGSNFQTIFFVITEYPLKV